MNRTYLLGIAMGVAVLGIALMGNESRAVAGDCCAPACCAPACDSCAPATCRPQHAVAIGTTRSSACRPRPVSRRAAGSGRLLRSEGMRSGVLLCAEGLCPGRLLCTEVLRRPAPALRCLPCTEVLLACCRAATPASRRPAARGVTTGSAPAVLAVARRAAAPRRPAAR